MAALAACPTEPNGSPKLVTSISLGEDFTLEAGKEYTIIPVIKPADAANQNVTWDSNDTDVATVDDGVVKAIAVGTAVITAAASDGSGKSGSVTVMVTAPEVTVTAPEFGLVRFNADNARYDGAGAVTNFGTGEKYLLYPVKVNLGQENDETISIQAKVKIISTAGNNGVGFISIANADRKGYMLLTAQDVRIVGTTTAIQNPQYTSPRITWAAGQEYVFKAEVTNRRMNCYVYDIDGTTELSRLLQRPLGHTGADVVYAAIGGTSVEDMEWSDIVVRENDRTYIINDLQEQSAIPVLTVSETAVRIFQGEQGSAAYTSIAAGGGNASATAVSSDANMLRVDSCENGIITFTGLRPGNAVITVTNTADTQFTVKIAVTVDHPFPENDTYGALTTVYPAAGSANAYADGELMIAFDNTPTLGTGREIHIYDKETGEKVDTILFASERQITLGNSNNDIAVGSQLARVAGNGVYFTPHFGKLEYGKQYYIAIAQGAITANLNGKPFIGLSRNKAVASWSFTVRAAPVLNENTPVAVNGSQNSNSDFRTVYGALAGIAARTGNWTINVAPGVYIELVHYVASAAGQTVTINGTGSAQFGKDVVIQYTNNNQLDGGASGVTMRRPSFYFSGANLVLKNIMLKNTSTRAGGDPGQAEAFYFDGNNRTMAAYNCSFLSHQDTIQTKGKNWFYKCYIEGDTDYIWGQADACLLEECELVSVNDPNKGLKEAILLVARTGSPSAATVPKGYVIFNSKVTTQNGMTTYFARNAGGSTFYDQCAVINTAFINEGTGKVAPAIWGGGTYTYLAGAVEHVGWKLYNNTVNGSPQNTSGMPANTAVISQAVYDVEYNGRYVILNRVYQKAGGYINAESVWDITALETAFNASPDASVRP